VTVVLAAAVALGGAAAALAQPGRASGAGSARVNEKLQLEIVDTTEVAPQKARLRVRRQGRARQDLHVRLSGAARRAALDVWLDDAGGSSALLGSMRESRASRGTASYEFRARKARRHALPFGVSDLSDLSGRGIEVRNGATVVVRGSMPDVVAAQPREFLPGEAAVFLVIDEDSIDNGNPPNGFSDVDVNDQIAEVGVRRPLRFFQNNVGRTIDLYTGEVGDEGWHALRTIPDSWREAGPTGNGTRNFLTPGPGLGAGTPDDDREVLLDKIPDVTPLRATGLSMLVGHTVLAVVYDSDVSINYSPLNGNLMGANLGIVAFEVLEVRERRDASDSSLPSVTIRILDASSVSEGELALFANAPVPRSSSDPFDVVPTEDPSPAELVAAE